MTRLADHFNFGSDLLNQNPLLYRQLSELYTSIALTLNNKANKYVSPDTNPPASSDFNKNFEIGDIYVRTDTNGVWIMTSRTSDVAVTWTAV